MLAAELPGLGCSSQLLAGLGAEDYGGASQGVWFQADDYHPSYSRQPEGFLSGEPE